MEKPASWIPHVEAFVNSARASDQQVTSVDAIATLVKNNLLTLEALVQEMEQYLTTTDHVIRARGILLLAEVLTCLVEEPFDGRTVSSLLEFFAAKLDDWQALHGALIGCLALLKRTRKFGMVESKDARMLLQYFFQNIQVQSLAVRDRKLCFEVLKCLFDVYPEAVVELGDEIFYGICEAIDDEKDPRCLMITFNLVATLGRLFPDQSSQMASFCEDIFDILSRYFPIFFTRPKNEGLGITRDDLSKALMDAFSSSSSYEPFVIPLLLEKLSSSLPSAKLDSLKYLNCCLSHYGANRMAKHANVIWSSLKSVIFNFSPQRPSLLTTGLAGDIESEVNQIANEAFNCLQTAISYLDFPDQDSFLCLIIDDEDIGKKFWSLTSIKNYSSASAEVQRELGALGSVLSILSKASMSSCSKVFQKFFPCLMDILGVSEKCSPIDHEIFSDGFNFGALYLSIELLTSCRELTIASKEIAPEVISEPTSWCFMLKGLSSDLSVALASVLKTVKGLLVLNGKEEHAIWAAKGLQVLATFPKFCSPISEATYEDILVMLMSIITSMNEETNLWKMCLQALIQIGLCIEDFHSPVGLCYNKVVIERIISMLQTKDSTIPLSLKFAAISEIVNADLCALKIIEALHSAILTNLVACIGGEVKSLEILVPLLECYSTQVLPRCYSYGNFNDIAVGFAVKIWSQMEDVPVFKSDRTMQCLLDQAMVTMKLLVAGCMVESQYLILRKAHCIVSSIDFLKRVTLPFTLSKLKDSHCIQDTAVLSCRDEWILSLFASVVISLHPQTPLIDVKVLLDMFIIFLLKGNVTAAQALASMINKWSADRKVTEVSTAYSLDQAIEEILINCLDKDICFDKSVVLGVAWVGKGLLMRGHEKVKEIALFLLKCIVHGQNVDGTPFQQCDGKGDELDASFPLATFAADAFNVLQSDSDDCLNKKFHATIRPLYKQRFFSIMLPILLSSIKESDSSSKKLALYRALGHVISNTPLAAVITEAKKIIPTLVDALSILSLDNLNKDMMYSLLLVLSGILMDDNGKITVVDNIHIIVDSLVKLVSYPHLMIIRETAIQCLVAITDLPHARIYPFRRQVIRAVSTALDDRKRAVRQEAVRCRQAWASIASRSLQL